MYLKEAKELLKEGIVNSVGNKKTGMAESCKEYQEAIETILQELDNLQKEKETLISEKTKLLLTDLPEANRLCNEENKRCMMLAIENNDLKEKIIEVEKENLVQKAVIYEECISKDKIREKIEEIKDKKLYVNGWDSEYEYATEVLQDLLKEE